jgi:hypothetical protein
MDIKFKKWSRHDEWRIWVDGHSVGTLIWYPDGHSRLRVGYANSYKSTPLLSGLTLAEAKIVAASLIAMEVSE